MSILDFDNLNKKEMIFHYVLESKGKGLSLAYNDIEVIEEWIQAIDDDCDSLLLILSDILPSYYTQKTKKVPLRKIRESVLQRIKDYRFSQETLL